MITTTTKAADTDVARDDLIPQYLKVLEDHKVMFPKIELARYGANNLALRAKSDIQDGDIVLSVPLDILLNNVTLRTRIWPSLQAFDPRAYGCDKWALMYLFLATEHAKGPASPYWAYLSMLPRVVGTPVSYTPEELELMASTNLHEAVVGIHAKLRGIEKMYAEVLRPQYPQVFAGCPPHVEYGALVWAYEVFWSRAFAVMVRDPFDPEWDETAPVASLVPLCGMLNHSPDAHVTYITDAENGVFCIQSNMPVAAGEQFYNNYRNRSNEKMLLNYGFFTPDNPLDTFTIKVNVHHGLDPLYARKRALLAACGVGWEHYLTKDPAAPVPDSLLDCLRVLSMSESELYFCACCGAYTPGAPVSERNEAETLRTLSLLLDKQLAKLRYKDYAADFARLDAMGGPAAAADPATAATYAAIYYRAWQARILAQSAAYARKRYAEKMRSLEWTPKFAVAPRCSSAAALDAYNACAAGGGGVFRGVRYAVEPETGFVRLVAERPLARGDPIIVVPSSDLLRKESAQALLGPEVRAIAERVDADDPNAFEILTSLVLVASLTGKLSDSENNNNNNNSEKDSNRNLSPLVKNFLTALPRSVVSPVFLSPDTIEECLGELPLVDDAIGFREQVMAEHKSVAANKRVKRSGVATKDYVWARATIEPRIVTLPSSASSCEPGMAVLPLPYLPRYSPYHRLEKHYDAALGAYVVSAGCDVPAGGEVFDNLGYDQPGDHLLRFGSLLACNPLATHRIDFVWGDDDVDPARLALLRRLGLSPEGNLLAKGQFPYALLHTIRILDMSDEEAAETAAQLDAGMKQQHHHQQQQQQQEEEKKNKDASSGSGSEDACAGEYALSVVARELSDETEAAAYSMLRDILTSALDALPQVCDSAALQHGDDSHDLLDALATYVAQQRAIIAYTMDRLTEIAGDKLAPENENEGGGDGKESEDVASGGGGNGNGNGMDVDATADSLMSKND